MAKIVFFVLAGCLTVAAQSTPVGPIPLKDTKMVFQRPRLLTNRDVIKLTQNGLCDHVIIEAIQSRGGDFRTNSTSLIELQRAGVSNRVMMEMQRHATEEE